MAKRAPKVLNALICDEVRQEMNGKHIIIGVYSGQILVPEFPAPLALSAYVEFMLPKRGEQNLHIRFCGPNGAMSGLNGAIDVPNVDQPVALATPRMPMLIERPSEITVELSLDDEQWVTAVRKEVRRGEPD